MKVMVSPRTTTRRKRAPRIGEGRPTKYQPRYCAMVEKHMDDGASLTSFAASIGVARSTINEWMAANPQFADACARAKARCAAWWERQGRAIAQNGAGRGSAQLAIFGMKNMGAEDWTESAVVDHRSTDGTMSPPSLADFYGAMRGKPPAEEAE